MDSGGGRRQGEDPWGVRGETPHPDFGLERRLTADAARRIPVRYAKAAAPRQSAKVSWQVPGRSLSGCCKDSVL